MPKSLKPGDLGRAIERELTIYGREVTNRLDEEALAATKKLTNLTRRTAPVGHRGRFKRSISWMQDHKSARGSSYVWYVRAPAHRLTHLLVHGHATKDGGRTKGDPFLANALDEVLPEYEQRVEEAVKNGK